MQFLFKSSIPPPINEKKIQIINPFLPLLLCDNDCESGRREIVINNFENFHK